MGSSTVATLAKHIGDLRRALRAANRDIFTNSKIVGWIFNWLDKLPVEKPAPGQQVAAIEWEGEEVANSETLAKKRKRQQRDEEEDPDYRGGPVPRFARSDVVGNTRSGAAAATRPATTTTRAGRVVVARNPSPPAKPVIPPPPAARPPPNAMDAPSAGSFGNFAQNLGPNAAQGYRSFNYAQPVSSAVGDAGALERQLINRAFLPTFLTLKSPINKPRLHNIKRKHNLANRSDTTLRRSSNRPNNERKIRLVTSSS